MNASYRNELVSVGVASVNVGADWTSLNQKRTNITIINTSTGGQVITLGIGQEAVTMKGITIYPGGSWESSAEAGYIPPQQRISAVSDLAGGSLSIYEEAV